MGSILGRALPPGQEPGLARRAGPREGSPDEAGGRRRSAHGRGRTSARSNEEETHRGVAQSGSAPASGAGSRRFKSSHPDHHQGVAQLGRAPALGAGGRWSESSRPDHRRAPPRGEAVLNTVGANTHVVRLHCSPRSCMEGSAGVAGNRCRKPGHPRGWVFDPPTFRHGGLRPAACVLCRDSVAWGLALDSARKRLPGGYETGTYPGHLTGWRFEPAFLRQQSP